MITLETSCSQGQGPMSNGDGVPALTFIRFCVERNTDR